MGYLANWWIFCLPCTGNILRLWNYSLDIIINEMKLIIWVQLSKSSVEQDKPRILFKCVLIWANVKARSFQNQYACWRTSVRMLCLIWWRNSTQHNSFRSSGSDRCMCWLFLITAVQFNIKRNKIQIRRHHISWFCVADTLLLQWWL